MQLCSKHQARGSPSLLEPISCRDSWALMEFVVLLLWEPRLLGKQHSFLVNHLGVDRLERELQATEVRCLWDGSGVKVLASEPDGPRFSPLDLQDGRDDYNKLSSDHCMHMHWAWFCYMSCEFWHISRCVTAIASFGFFFHTTAPVPCLLLSSSSSPHMGLETPLVICLFQNL